MEMIKNEIKLEGIENDMRKIVVNAEVRYNMFEISNRNGEDRKIALDFFYNVIKYTFDNYRELKILCDPESNQTVLSLVVNCMKEHAGFIHKINMVLKKDPSLKSCIKKLKNGNCNSKELDAIREVLSLLTTLKERQ